MPSEGALEAREGQACVSAEVLAARQPMEQLSAPSGPL